MAVHEGRGEKAHISCKIGEDAMLYIMWPTYKIQGRVSGHNARSICFVLFPGSFLNVGFLKAGTTSSRNLTAGPYVTWPSGRNA